jgi:hypothetical protein
MRFLYHTTLPRGRHPVSAETIAAKLRTERLKILAQSTSALNPSRFRYPAIFLQSAEVAVWKSDSKSVAYEFRTKSAQSGGLETNGRRDGILKSRPAHRSGEVRARSPWLLGLMRARKPAENVGRARTGGESGIRNQSMAAPTRSNGSAGSLHARAAVPVQRVSP